MDPLILISNPGSASRKYALYRGTSCLAKIHFEIVLDKLVYTVQTGDQTSPAIPATVNHLAFAAKTVFDILKGAGFVALPEEIKLIAYRVVAPLAYFQKDRLLDSDSLKKLADLEPRAQIHINATLQEIEVLKKQFPGSLMVGVSDSAFHASIPEFAHRYGLPPKDADRFEIKRFGYHGLSVESVVKQLHANNKLPKRLIVCHLGSGCSVTAVRNGGSIDTTMGYSPLEGLIMATRSGNLDVTAAQVLHQELNMTGRQLQNYLNNNSGLLGLSGKPANVAELLDLQKSGDKAAALALKMFIYRICQAVGQMSASLGGVDSLVFTGTVGERSAEVRRRVISRLLFLGLSLDTGLNHKTINPQALVLLSPTDHPAKVYVASSDENGVIAARAQNFL